MASYSDSIQKLYEGSGSGDKISLSAVSYSTVQAGAGNDTIYAQYGSNYNRYEGGAGADVIYVNYDSLKGGASNTIGGGVGNTVSGGAGNDIIYVGPASASAGGKNIRSYNTVIEYSNDDGNDTIKDSISGGGQYSEYTIKLTAGTLASTQISGKNIILKIAPSAASTSETTSTLTLEGAAVPQTVSGETIPGANISLTGSGEIFVSRNHDNASKVTVVAGEDPNDFNKATLVGAKDSVGNLAEITNRGHHVSIGGSFVTAYNYGSNVTITGGKTAVTVENRGAENRITGSSVADYIENYDDANNINGGKGNDIIVNVKGYKSSLFGGADKDTIRVDGAVSQAVTVSGDAGDDYIYNNGQGTVIIGGAGNDIIVLNSDTSTASALVQYASGSGNDTIYGFSANDTLNITKGNVSVVGTDGNDLILTIDKNKGKITLKDMADKAINLKTGSFGTLSVTSDTMVSKTAAWSFADGVATYGWAAKPVVQISGVNENATASDFSIKGTTVTVKEGALNSETTLSIIGGKLKLDSTVTKSTTTAGKWVSGGSSGTTGNYTAAKVTAGYVLSSDGKSVTYNTASRLGGFPVLSVSGLAKNGYKYITVNESTGIVTLAKKALPTGSSSVSIELNNSLVGTDLAADYPEYCNFKLAIAAGAVADEKVDASWSVSGTTATYKSAGENATFKVADDGLSISYVTASTKRETLATLKGIKKGTKATSLFVNKDSAGNETITLTKDQLSTTNVTLDTAAGYNWKLALPTDGTVPDPVISKQSYWKTSTVTKKIDGETVPVSTTATFVTPKIDKNGAGYAVTDAGQTITYYKASSGGANALILKGLAPELTATAAAEVTASVAGTLQGVEYSTTEKTVKIAPEAVAEDQTIQIAGTFTAGTIFSFEVDSDTNVASGVMSNTTKTAAVMQGNTGDDTFTGGGGADTLNGDAGADVLNGGAGNDVIDGGAGADKLVGGAGNDSMNGGAGNDVIDGGAGNDVIDGGTGYDSLSGGAGNDLMYSGTGNTQTVLGGAGNDTIYGQNAGIEADDDGLAVFDEETNKPSVVFNAGAGNDVVSLTGGSAYVLGDAGNDKLYGGSGDDSLYGDAGNDSLFAGGGADYLDGGAGTDKLYAQSSAAATLNGGAGNDTLFAEEASGTFDGDDFSVVLDGGAGADVLKGGSGATSLSGGAGADKLYGGAGKVTMTGGEGSNNFYYSAEYGDNVITDYGNVTNYKDVINLTDYSAAAVTATKTDDTTILFNVGGKTLTVMIDPEKIYTSKGKDTETTSIVVKGVNSKKKADSKTFKIADIAEAVEEDEDGLFAEDNFITADSNGNLSDIVETASVGEFELNAKSDKLQAENLITYSDK